MDTASENAMTAAELADLSAVIRDYLSTETDVSAPSFHATALTHRLASAMGDHPEWTCEHGVVGGKGCEEYGCGTSGGVTRLSLTSEVDAYLRTHGGCLNESDAESQEAFVRDFLMPHILEAVRGAVTPARSLAP